MSDIGTIRKLNKRRGTYSRSLYQYNPTVPLSSKSNVNELELFAGEGLARLIPASVKLPARRSAAALKISAFRSSSSKSPVT